MMNYISLETTVLRNGSERLICPYESVGITYFLFVMGTHKDILLNLVHKTTPREIDMTMLSFINTL